MRSEYNPRKYFFEDMKDSFQADLADPEEQIDEELFRKACLKSEKNSLYFELDNEAEIAKFRKTANTFDARLIGVINEWAEAEDKTYARDGILLDGKTASQIMWERGCSFIDVIGMTQKALDDPGHSPFDKIQISIGGPAFMTSENILLSVKEKGQISKDNRERSNLGRMEPRAHQSTLHTKSQNNRELLLTEQEQEENREVTDSKLTQDRDDLKELIEKEEQALELFGEKAEKGMKPGEYTATFFMLGKDGQVHEKVTSNAMLAEHKADYEALSKPEEYMKQSPGSEKRERISLSDLEEPSDRRSFDRHLQKPGLKAPELKSAHKEPDFKRDGFRK